MDTEEDTIVRSVARKLERKYVPKHSPSQNDKDVENAEARLDRIEGEVMHLHRESQNTEYSPVIAGVKEQRLLENFR